MKKRMVLCLLCMFLCMIFPVNAEQQTDTASFSVSGSFTQKYHEKVTHSENSVEIGYKNMDFSHQMQPLYFRQNIRQVKTERSLRNFYVVAVAIVFFPILLFLCDDSNFRKKYAKLWQIVAYIHETDGKKRR